MVFQCQLFKPVIKSIVSFTKSCFAQLFPQHKFIHPATTLQYILNTSVSASTITVGALSSSFPSLSPVEIT